MVTKRKSLSFILVGLLCASDLFSQSIQTVTTRYQVANDFKTISSYFTDGDNTGPRIINRTQEDDWDGLYFIIEFTDRPETFEKKISVVIDVLTAFSPKPRQYAFTLSEPDTFTWEGYFGITGTDWTDQETRPLAWKISIKDFEGNLITEKQSFLWK
ncbi:MAG: hypothetical protein ACPGN3_11035 [Opitutales bacterium]